MYANSRNLRLEALQDVENGEGSWDGETIKALMGSGCLYVLRERTHILLIVVSCEITFNFCGTSVTGARGDDWNTEENSEREIESVM